MIDSKLIDDLAQRLSNTLPASIQSMQGDVMKNLRAGLESGLARLELVSREEFEVQAAVLSRTREKLKRLEEQVKALEEQQR
ncbi:MAG: accessory factor UbiK family protein [Candidatus Thiodiazotropha sp. (ex. Lucinisca nassula)]|nr:accessory factor UbiK family protein [Candidatus Thiodiazotropha sp. (ex. Lucinisca nassula)]MBW9263152.1 accessory factor UbiK family protein [Candidatus Thiodiazotropha sp. (ex. Lucinisca nassula)]MBW9270707.1 accessory factor UbiK family protein [Candidatus Thiodiazotropha sp. (ex. Lucinisca nassula)]